MYKWLQLGFSVVVPYQSCLPNFSLLKYEILDTQLSEDVKVHEFNNTTVMFILKAKS